LQRALRENKNSAAQQIEIIQEEVVRADKVVTQIMGYAQLGEGRVEKLDVIEELDRAVAQVFPPAVPLKIQIHHDYGRDFPPLLMQRGHLSEMRARRSVKTEIFLSPPVVTVTMPLKFPCATMVREFHRTRLSGFLKPTTRRKKRAVDLGWPSSNTTRNFTAVRCGLNRNLDKARHLS
jgi:hypothetical protein